MRVFLTGSTGILGTDISKVFEAAGNEIVKFSSSNISLADYGDVRKKVVDFKPDVVIHCAALTNVDRCEDDRQEAIATNVVGSKNLAAAAFSVGAKIIYISSCGVYGDGKQTPHNELDNVNPLNFHHFTKLQGEVFVKQANPDHLIIRPGWLFGGSPEHKKNFVEARRREMISGNPMVSAIDKFGSPTFTRDVAEQLKMLVHHNLTGTFNVVNEGSGSRFDYVSEIALALGLEIEIKPVSSASFLRKATMPDNESLSNLFLDIHGVNIMKPWRFALSEYIKSQYL